MSRRVDDFKMKTQRGLLHRAGGRCSNPDCRKLTSKPDPTNERSFINLGIASHITGASEGGPRFDPDLSSDQRTDVNNGIWLCNNCAKMVDSSEPTYTVTTLRKWKQDAEQKAARDASSTSQEIETLLSSMEEVSQDILEYTHTRRIHDTTGPFADGEDFGEYSRKIINYSSESRNLFERNYHGKVADIIRRCEAILNPDNQALEESRKTLSFASTNLLGMEMMAKRILELSNELLLR